jgi:hypothetical protein
VASDVRSAHGVMLVSVPSVTLVDLLTAYPETDAERKTVAGRYLRQLTETWFHEDLPEPEIFHVLVHRPGETGRTQDQMTHRGDESEAWEEETGRVAVAITLTDIIEGVEDLEVLRIRRTGP